MGEELIPEKLIKDELPATDMQRICGSGRRCSDGLRAVVRSMKSQKDRN
jgi:hypothetical protein